MQRGIKWFGASVFLCLALLAPLGVAGQQQTVPPWRVPLDPARDVVQVTIGDQVLQTELAIFGNQQTLGLGYRNSLDEDAAMLFVNDEAAPHTFWMKGMRFCLDIIWIEQGQIVGAAENACPDPAGTPDKDRARFASPEPVTYILEVNAGFLQEHGYGAGTPVIIPPLPDL
jgi:uncharacterized membrane protein (UPF0127 family)